MTPYMTAGHKGLNAMGVAVARVPFADFEALRHSVADAPLDIVQLENGPISGEMQHLRLGTNGIFGTIDISHGHFTRGIRARGLMSPTRWNFSMLVGDDPAVVNHAPIKPGDAFIVRPNQEVYVAHPRANHYSAVNISEEAVLAFVAGQAPGAVDSSVWKDAARVLEVDPALAAERVEAFRTLTETLVTVGPTMDDRLVEFYQRNLLELVTEPVFCTVKEYGEQRVPAAELVNRVDEFLMRLVGPIHISELCEIFSVSRRTLHRAFHDVLGIAPITFFRNKRLGDVHSALLRGGAGLVRDVAMQHGFLQLGKFGAQYKRLFGEKPSQTARRANRALGLMALVWMPVLLNRSSSTIALIDCCHGVLRLG